MANKTIHQLTPASTITGDTQFAIYDTDNDSTKKATASQILGTIQGKINTIQELLGSSSISNVGSSITGIIGNEALTTTAQTLAEAINEHQTDISTLNSNLMEKIKTSDLITITPSVGSSYSTYGNCYYYKRGARVHVHIGISELAPNASNNIFSLGAGYRPISPVIAAGKSGSSVTGYASIQINQNGGINISSIDSYALCDIEYDTYA